jgi:hypothetical protein
VKAAGKNIVLSHLSNGIQIERRKEMDSYGMIFLVVLMVALLWTGNTIGYREGFRSGREQGIQEGITKEKNSLNRTLAVMRTSTNRLNVIDACRLYDNEKRA